MAAEVVGTAFVRIRALTKGLSKDIDKALNKAIKDANLDKPGKTIGDSVAASASEQINKGLKETVEKLDLDGTKAGTKLGDSLSDSTSDVVKKRLKDIGLDTELTHLGEESAKRLSTAFNNRLDLAKKFKLDPQIVRNTVADFDNLFTKEEPRFGRSITGFFSRTFRRITPDLSRTAGGAGGRASKSFGDRFVDGLKKAVARVIPVLTPTIGSIVSFLVQGVVAIGAQISLLIEAAIGGAVAAGAAAGAVGIAILPLIAAFNVDTKRLQQFKQIGEDVGKAWRTFGIATQKTLLPALGDSLKLTKRLIPVFSEYGAQVGALVGFHTKLLAQTVTGEEGQRRFAAIFDGSLPILNNFLAILRDVGDIVSNIFIEALPAATAFSNVLVTMFERWRAIVQAGTDSGRLGDVILDWYLKAALVFGALSDVAAAIFNIIQVGGTAAVPFFQNFATWAQEFRDFTASEAGQNKIKQIFDDALEVAHAFNLLVIDIVERIGGGIFEEGGNEGLITFFDTLRLKIVPLIDDAIRPLIEDLGPQLTEFFVAFAEVLTALGESGAIEVTVQVLTLFADAINGLLSIPGMDTLAGTILGIAGAFTVLKLVLPGFVTGPIVSLLGFLGGVAWSAIAAGVSAVGSAFVTLVLTVGSALGVGLTAAFAIVIGIIVAVIAVIALLVIHWDKVKEAFNATVRFLKDPMARLERLGEVLQNIGGVIVRALAEALSRLPGIIFRALKFLYFDLPLIVLRALLGLAARIGPALLRALSRLPGIIGRALGRLAEVALSALGDFGGMVIDGILTGLAALPGLLRTAFVTAIQLGIQGFFLWITAIPNLLIALFTTVGPLIGSVIADAFGVAIRFVTGTLPTIFGTVLNFFTQVPGLIAGALAALGGALVDVFTAAWSALTGWLTGSAGPAVLSFFTQLPGRIVNAIISLPGVLREAFNTAMEAAKTVVSAAINGIVDFFVKLPGRITGLVGTILSAAKEIGGAVLDGIVEGLSAAASFAGDVAGAVADALVDAINGLIGILNDAIPNKLGKGFLTIDIPDNPIPELALGGVFTQPTTVLLGEAGKEVVIPLTKPARAAQLARESGLLDLLASQQGTATPTSISFDVTVNPPLGMTHAQAVAVGEGIGEGAQKALERRRIAVLGRVQ